MPHNTGGAGIGIGIGAPVRPSVSDAYSKSMPLFISNLNSMDEKQNTIEPMFTKEMTPISISSLKQKQHQSKTHNHGIHPILQKSWASIRATLSKNFLQRKLTTLFAAALIMASVFFAPMQEALAAPSGGRMGGSFGGSSRSSSSSRSYSRGSSGSYNRGYSSGYYSRPNVIIAPQTYGYGAGGGYYARPGGVAVVRTGPSIADVIVFGIVGSLVLSSLARPMLDGNDSSTTSALGPGVTVAQISVALNVPRRNDPSSILSFLDRLSSTASTDSRVGISDLVSQVSVELLRQKRSIFAADTEFKHFRDGDAASRYFNTEAIKERSKFEKESTNKFGGVDYSVSKGKSLPAGDEFSPQATSAVVTLVVSIDGDSTKMPQINSINDLEKALIRLATDVKVDDCLRSAEVLWTPDDKLDVISERDVVVDYPKLRSI